MHHFERVVHWCLQAARQNNDSRAHRFIGQIGMFSAPLDVALIRQPMICSDVQNKWRKWFISVWQHGFSADWAEKLADFLEMHVFRRKHPEIHRWQHLCVAKLLLWCFRVASSSPQSLPSPIAVPTHARFFLASAHLPRRKMMQQGIQGKVYSKAEVSCAIQPDILGQPHSWKHHQFSAKKPGFQSWKWWKKTTHRLIMIYL